MGIALIGGIAGCSETAQQQAGPAAENGSAAATSSSLSGACVGDTVDLLTQVSEFSGRWRHVRSGDTGPVSLSFEEIGPELAVFIRDEGYAAQVAGDTVRFRTNAGPHELRLKPDCDLAGTQRHRNGEVRITTSAGPRDVASGGFAGDPLSAIEGRSYTGIWEWGDLRGDFDVRFERRDGAVFAVGRVEGRDDGPDVRFDAEVTASGDALVVQRQENRRILIRMDAAGRPEIFLTRDNYLIPVDLG